MSKTIQEKMDEQHRHWLGELESWQSDVTVWKQELEAAMVDLRDVESMLSDSLDGLGVHGDAVWEALQRLKAHEEVIGEESRLRENRTDREWRDIHETLSSGHARIADHRARIGKHHQEVVAAVAWILKTARPAV